MNVMLNIAFLAYLMVVMVPLNWYLEIRADRIAVDSFRTIAEGKASMVHALLRLMTGRDDFEQPSEDHPAMSERIKAILKYRLGTP